MQSTNKGYSNWQQADV